MSATVEKFQPIYEGRDLYVPAFDLKVDGRDLDTVKGPDGRFSVARDVIDVRYTDSIDKVDTMEITVNNWDAERLDFKYTGSKTDRPDEMIDIFLPGKTVELHMGYFRPVAGRHDDRDKPEPLRMMLLGKINKLTPNFPAAGQPTLKVSAQSVLSQMSAKQETFHYDERTFGTKPKASMIADKVGKRRKLMFENKPIDLKTEPGIASSEPELEYVLQDNQFDIVFLLQLAHRHGYDVLLKYESKDKQQRPYLYFGPAGREPRLSYRLEWGRSLIQFQPTLTTSKQVKEVTVRGWDMTTKQPVKVTVDRTMLPNSPLRDKKQLDKLEEGFKEKNEIVVDQPFRSMAEAKEYAKALLMGIAGNMVTARGSTVGTPDLRAGSRVEIAKVGQLFSGTYTVKTTTHSITSGGYVTDFEARLEEKRR
ncbi:MAG TPA: hypothetical protein VGB73_07710 [Pyrinomonadaceae bacterium]|jgi:phage protein D